MVGQGLEAAFGASTSAKSGGSSSVRRLESWIESFVQYTEPVSSPPIFRRWSAIACVAGALEMKVWIRYNQADRYPGMYTVLVGPAGVGKSEPLGIVRSFWEKLEGHKISATSVTSASLMDELREAERKLVMPSASPPVVSFNSVKVLSSELGVLLPTYENEMMNTLTDIWDNRPYGQRRRTKDLQFAIPRPQINLLAGTTPVYFSTLLPNGAWDMGFLARTMLIYCGDTTVRDPFAEIDSNVQLEKDLIHDLRVIAEMYGKMTFTKEAAQFLTDWVLGGQSPVPEHPRLASYNVRRSAHLGKMVMVASASRSSSLLIEKQHVQEALDWMVEAEDSMESIFKAMNSGGDIKIMEEAWYFTYTAYLKNGKKLGISEKDIVQFISSRTPAHNVMRILETMTKAGWINDCIETFGKAYKPAMKK